MSIGKHVIAELSLCNPERLDNMPYIEMKMRQAAEQAGATVVHSCFKKFEPQGVTGVLVLSESHLSIHTWPEKGYAAVDIYTCGAKTQPSIAIGVLIDAFKAQAHDMMYIERGLENADGTHRMKVPGIR